MTAAEVADELEVSVQTARRDLEALAAAGIPVYSQAGRGGGWQLLGGGRVDLSGLSAPEARALFLVAGPSTRASPEAKAALRKLVRALPAPFRHDAEAAASAVVIDAEGWGAAAAPAPPHMEELRRAVIERVQVRIRYGDRGRPPRLVHPLGLAAKGGIWYLIADTSAGRRTFRVERIHSAELTAEPAVRPEGFDLAVEWRSIAAAVEARRTRMRAVVLAGAEAVDGLRVQFGSDVGTARRLSDGRFELLISGSSARQIAERLAGWGSEVDVESPPEVRDRLAEIGAELVESYRGAPKSTVSALGDRQVGGPLPIVAEGGREGASQIGFGK
jgi:predicted DNA-binding transcriptional regulator YafY